MNAPVYFIDLTPNPDGTTTASYPPLGLSVSAKDIIAAQDALHSLILETILDHAMMGIELPEPDGYYDAA